MNGPIFPKRLQPGDTVALVAPASAPADSRVVDRSVAAVEAMGFKARPGRHARKRLGFLAGNDRERAADLMEAFGDRRVRGIFCIRGGYGSPRLLTLLDYRIVRNNPKVFVGFSDITALHCAFLQEANLVTFHGPMTGPQFTDRDYPGFSRRSFARMLMEPAAYGSIRRGYRRKTVSILRGGKVSGPLMGGNLSLLCSLMGTRFQPDFRGRILFLEDVGEEPYRIDRMLTQLLNAGVLEAVAGIAVGICKDCEKPKTVRVRGYNQTLVDVLKERLMPLKVPVVMGLPFGHFPYNATLPVGGRATLNAGAGDLVLTQAGVS